MNNFFSYTSVLICFLLFSNTIQAQTGGKSKWSAGIVFSLDYTYRKLTYPDSVKVWKEHFDENDLPKFGYTAGVSMLYQLHDNFELESGLLYSNKGHRYKLPIENQWHETDPAVPLEALTTYSFRYLDVPVKLNWFFLQKKSRLFLSAGMSAGIFIDELTVYEAKYPDRVETSRYHEEDVDMNAVTLALIGGVGIDYPLTERLFIRLNPEFRYGVIPVADIPWKRYNWSVGLNTGVYIKL